MSEGHARTVTDVPATEDPRDALIRGQAEQIAVLQALVVTGPRITSPAVPAHDIWGAEPRALLGITVPGMPNFFMLYGPNTNGGEIFSNHRAQIMWATRSARRLQRRGGTKRHANDRLDSRQVAAEEHASDIMG
jgi:cation diffusion facilitator CzcD-associated flavoprotein CzcO